ncbi:Antibiotic biosynthesis monooxygenase [Yersinia frederiksenii]|nr:Antibiotic biosynthesis monooxygenase [Yersinia frederiksenii]
MNFLTSRAATTLFSLSLMSAANAEPLLRIFELGIQDNQQQAFNVAGQENLTASISTEPGVLAMYAVTVKGHPEQWRFVEIYADDAAYELHRQTPHFQHYIHSTADMLQDKKLTVLANRTLVNKGGLYFNILD